MSARGGRRCARRRRVRARSGSRRGGAWRRRVGARCRGRMAWRGRMSARGGRRCAGRRRMSARGGRRCPGRRWVRAGSGSRRRSPWRRRVGARRRGGSGCGWLRSAEGSVQGLTRAIIAHIVGSLPGARASRLKGVLDCGWRACQIRALPSDDTQAVEISGGAVRVHGCANFPLQGEAAVGGCKVGGPLVWPGGIIKGRRDRDQDARQELAGRVVAQASSATGEASWQHRGPDFAA